MNPAPVIVWFRRDLRLADNPALSAALATGAPLVLVFIDDRGTHDSAPLGAAASWWLHESIRSLSESIKMAGNRLILRKGHPYQVLNELITETGAQSVHWNRRYEPMVIRRDAEIKASLSKTGLAATSHNGSLLHEPWIVKNKSGNPFRVFTPYWRHCLTLPVSEPLPAPTHLKPIAKTLPSENLEDLRLQPTFGWDAGISAAWQPGESRAQEGLDLFLTKAFADYSTERDRPDQTGTSRLSPHLQFGEISPRQIRQGLQKHAQKLALPSSEWIGSQFLAELGWREFANHLLYHFPETVRHPLRAEFENFPWRSDPQALIAWQKGRTGYPIVDAGMRELWTTGWMHNRVRMITASFLVKDLLIDWRHGADWFMDTLVDADLAANTLGWQWTAGCGADAAPFFRIFNPTSQGERFDPDGDYVRRWVPELAKLPKRWIHQPWNAPAAVLQSAGIRPGQDYPEPIVSHAIARNVALEAFQKIKTRP
ncbi:MAG: deoxyribodipyrimidine photo-lyase [Verrucomicrobiae bacterium]|nr:deoxyribodipyrimidine photo-lyase [Verrucomicrobiae bacterium]